MLFTILDQFILRVPLGELTSEQIHCITQARCKGGGRTGNFYAFQLEC